MTFDQLKYAVIIAEKGNITEAAKSLFLAQPSLSASIHELEKEIGIEIFCRTNRGVTVTRDGEKFLGYARQVVEQMGLLEEQYLGEKPLRHQFCVSTQHYSFAVKAFSELIRQYGGEEYDFRIRETKTWEIIEDVSMLRSSIGILYFNKFNKEVLKKTLLEHSLKFYPLFTAKPHVFIGISNPLSRKKKIELKDLDKYPRLSYEQGEHNSFYFSEEILSTRHCSKDIMVSDRATLFNLLIGLNGYTICSGVINKDLNGENIIARPLDVDDEMNIGYILPARSKPGYFTSDYIELLKLYARQS
ncbi:MAG: LysR family transcriptional regulator [Candidatus Weimeria sp.]